MRRVGFLPLILLLSACGGGSPAGPTTPPSPPAPVYSLGVVVFYDDNGNGVLDPTESVRLPNVSVQAGGQSARTSSTGAAMITNVPGGSQAITIAADSLPLFWEQKTPLSVNVPQAANVVVPVTLSIGSNRPNTYMAFGDSITIGDGSSDGEGYRGRLQRRLADYLGAATVLNEGADATKSNRGAARIGDSLNATHPAYALIHYGTNDWNDGACRSDFPCYTLDSLRTIVEACKANGTLPMLATIIPTNVGYDDRVPPQRNDWVDAMDVEIRKLAKEEGVGLVDLEKAFLDAAGEDLDRIFSDHVHPNDDGYEIMAKTWFDAITKARGTGTTSSLGPFLNPPEPGPSSLGVDFAPPGHAASRESGVTRRRPEDDVRLP